MLDENPDEPLDAAEYYPVDHHRTVLAAVGAGVFQLKPFRKLEIELDGAALPGAADGILQMEVDLGAVEGTVPLIDFVVEADLV